MKLEFLEVPQLPRLSWCATIKKGDETVRLMHGPWIERAQTWFCEGAWSGEFGEGNFDTLPFFGTGGKTIDDGLLISPPSHTLERIYACRTGGALFASNSLAFILYATNDSLDPTILDYYSRLSSIRYGLRAHNNSLTTLAKNIILLYYYHNILITPDLDILTIEKPSAPEFDNYSSYVKYVTFALGALHRNANCSDRRVQYSPQTTISTGYDSAAVSVLSRSMDCIHAVTFTNARGWRQVHDSGDGIAVQLGLQARKFKRTAYLALEDFPEVDTFGFASEFASIRESLSSKLLLTGFHGDTVWDRNCRYVSRDIIRGDASGSDLGELRYRWGFVHVPVPFLASTSLPSIYRISRSEEMRPWTLGNDYDRPIPRRLVEEAGVRRESFGQKKKAAAIYPVQEGLRHVMTANSYRDFTTRCLKKHWHFRQRAVAASVSAYLNLRSLNVRTSKKIGYLSLGQRRFSVPIMLPNVSHYGRECLLIHWATEKLIDRYRVACANAVGRYAVFGGNDPLRTEKGTLR